MSFVEGLQELKIYVLNNESIGFYSLQLRSFLANETAISETIDLFDINVKDVNAQQSGTETQFIPEFPKEEEDAKNLAKIDASIEEQDQEEDIEEIEGVYH